MALKVGFGGSVSRSRVSSRSWPFGPRRSKGGSRASSAVLAPGRVRGVVRPRGRTAFSEQILTIAGNTLYGDYASRQVDQLAERIATIESDITTGNTDNNIKSEIELKALKGRMLDAIMPPSKGRKDFGYSWANEESDDESKIYRSVKIGPDCVVDLKGVVPVSKKTKPWFGTWELFTPKEEKTEHKYASKTLETVKIGGDLEESDTDSDINELIKDREIYRKVTDGEREIIKTLVDQKNFLMSKFVEMEDRHALEIKTLKESFDVQVQTFKDHVHNLIEVSQTLLGAQSDRVDKAQVEYTGLHKRVDQIGCDLYHLAMQGKNEAKFIHVPMRDTPHDFKCLECPEVKINNLEIKSSEVKNSAGSLVAPVRDINIGNVNFQKENCPDCKIESVMCDKIPMFKFLRGNAVNESAIVREELKAPPNTPERIEGADMEDDEDRLMFEENARIKAENLKLLADLREAQKTINIKKDADAKAAASLSKKAKKKLADKVAFEKLQKENAELKDRMRLVAMKVASPNLNESFLPSFVSNLIPKTYSTIVGPNIKVPVNNSENKDGKEPLNLVPGSSFQKKKMTPLEFEVWKNERIRLGLWKEKDPELLREEKRLRFEIMKQEKINAGTWDPNLKPPRKKQEQDVIAMLRQNLTNLQSAALIPANLNILGAISRSTQDMANANQIIGSQELQEEKVMPSHPAAL
jgi:hypothetical protein